MPKSLPARPNLEHLKTQAKALLSKLREGNSQAARTFAQYLPEAAKLTPAQVRERGFRLADAQAIVARKTGFSAWPMLARHVDRLRSMEGTWAFRSLEIDGQAVPASMLGSSQLLIDGDRFRMESPEAVYEGLFLIDVEANPHRIDIDFYEGPEAGNRCEGLFELDGDRFRICLALAGSTRPAAFATSPGSGHALEELERVMHARPPHVDGGTRSDDPPQQVPVEEASGGINDFPLTLLLERLQGLWEPLELVNSGQPLQPSYLSFGSRTQTGVETKVVFGGQTMVHAKMRCNEKVEPIEVDYLHLAGRGKGKVARGLFRWEDNGAVATFCMAGPGEPRPADFTCAPGSGRTFSRWRRRPMAGS